MLRALCRLTLDSVENTTAKMFIPLRQRLAHKYFARLND
jgi:hypothetical protein